jgi:hypothetical protein
MYATHDKGGWVVCERKDVKIVYLSRRFETKEKAGVERDRMGALPLYQGRELEVTFLQTEPQKKRPVNSSRRSSRR